MGDISQSINLNTAPSKPLFSPTFLNLEYLFNQILSFLQRLFDSIFGGDSGLFLKVLFSILSIFFITVIVYCLVRMLEIRKKEHEHLHHEIEEYAEKQIEKENKKNGVVDNTSKNERWNAVLQYLGSPNESDWKLSVIEADSILEDLTEQLKFEGENLGERLKNADKEKFKTLDKAWEAHIVRNRIAHEGLSFHLSDREAKRVVYLYEQVFHEFGNI